MTLLEGLDPTETISAVSTPPGMGGIGIVRLSGSRAHAICRSIFKPRSHLTGFSHRKMVLGDLIDPDTREIVDEVFSVFMFAPQTYTCEDMAEIQCHSGRVVMERILDLTLRQGARLAGPGEFTLRAYLNGRIDLTQAEGVIAVIQARSETALKMAQRQLHGKVREVIESLLHPIRRILMYVEADLDFSEDTGMDFEETWRDIWSKSRQGLFREIARLMEGFATCQMLREGVRVVIIGSPNVGKSCILNRFVGRERAIVTDIPGTTRDFIEEGILIQGIPFRIVDTAGLRPSQDPVERIGAEQALRRKEEADIVLNVIDASRPLSREDIQVLRELNADKTILVLNKCDLPLKVTPDEVMPFLPRDVPRVTLSAKTGQNWDQLTHLLFEKLRGLEDLGDLEALIPINQRHYQLLRKAEEALAHLDEGLEQGVEEVFLSQDLWEAKRALEAVLGVSGRDEILSGIFQNFCVGK